MQLQRQLEAASGSLPASGGEQQPEAAPSSAKAGAEGATSKQLQAVPSGCAFKPGGACSQASIPLDSLTSEVRQSVDQAEVPLSRTLLPQQDPAFVERPERKALAACPPSLSLSAPEVKDELLSSSAAPDQLGLSTSSSVPSVTLPFQSLQTLPQALEPQQELSKLHQEAATRLEELGKQLQRNLRLAFHGSLPAPSPATTPLRTPRRLVGPKTVSWAPNVSPTQVAGARAAGSSPGARAAPASRFQPVEVSIQLVKERGLEVLTSPQSLRLPRPVAAENGAYWLQETPPQLLGRLERDAGGVRRSRSAGAAPRYPAFQRCLTLLNTSVA